MLAQLWIDLRYATRIGLRRKWVSVAILVSMALGIGGTTAIFTVIDRVLLRPLPVLDPDRVVWLRTEDSRRPGPRPYVNPGDEYDLRTRSTMLSKVAPYNEAETTVRVGDDGAPERVRMALVGQGMAEVLGMRPHLGRFFTADDYAGGSPNIVVTHRFWRRALSGDPQAVGRSIFLNNVARTVIAVLPPAGDLLPEPTFEIWRPMLDNQQQITQQRTATYLLALGRLKPGISLAQARAEVDALGRTMAAEHPLTNATRSFVLEPLQDGIIGGARGMFLLLGGAIVMVLLIACGSVGNLLVAQSHERARELAVRAALGGSGTRLVRQLLTESGLLCALGGMLGVMLAPVLLRGFASLYPGGMPRAAELSVDLRVLFASTAAIALAGLLAGLPLVRQALRLELGRDLRDGGRSAGSIRQRRLATVLVVGQLALSLMLLFAGSLLLETYRALARTDTGFETEHLLTFDVSPSRARYATVQQVDGYYVQLVDGLRAIPGVRSAGVSNLIPFATGNLTELYTREGKNDLLPNQPGAKLQVVSDDFVAAIGLPLLRGRGLAASDADSTPPVVVINAALAAAHFPGEDALGRRVGLRGRTWEIVGIVGDKRHSAIREPAMPEMFISRRQLPREAGSWVVVRSSGHAASLVPAVRAVARAIDPTIAVARVATMSERLSEAVAPERFRATLVGSFAVLALALATIGLYGVVSHTVSQRTREIGIRMALGENASSVLRRIVAGAAGMSGAGVAIGSLGALLFGHWLQTFLVGASARDPRVLFIVAAILCFVTLAAAYIPARRASRVEPIIALRGD